MFDKIPTDESLNKLLTEAVEKLNLAIFEAHELETDLEKMQIGKLGYSIGLVRELQEQIFKRRPDLRPKLPSDEAPDPEMTEEQTNATLLLSQKEIDEIDKIIISISSYRWQKVAKIVATTMCKHPSRVKGIPDLFYSQRVRKLVNEGILESLGDLRYMRYSEVRFLRKNNNNK